MTTTSAGDDVVYIDSDIPPVMTIHEWRRQRQLGRAAAHPWWLRGRSVARAAVAGARRVVVWALSRLELARDDGREAPSLAGRTIHRLILHDATPRSLLRDERRDPGTVG
jgi:hypothetical protein